MNLSSFLEKEEKGGGAAMRFESGHPRGQLATWWTGNHTPGRAAVEKETGNAKEPEKSCLQQRQKKGNC